MSHLVQGGLNLGSVFQIAQQFRHQRAVREGKEFGIAFRLFLPQQRGLIVGLLVGGHGCCVDGWPT